MRITATKYLLEVLLFLPPNTADVGQLQNEELLMSRTRDVYTLGPPLKMTEN